VNRSATSEAPRVETFVAAGLERTVLVFAPAPSSSAPPLVFLFHGRGGTAEGAAHRMPFHRNWPEAVVAYAQGLPPGQPAIHDPEGKRPAWQRLPGELGDRDVLFFDAACETLGARYSCDRQRIYLIGHSNGGRFANLLWRMRGEAIAAVCSAGSQGGKLIPEAPPRSIFMVMGEKDRVAPLAGQEKSIALARERLETNPDSATVAGPLRSERSLAGLELAVYRHPGGHELPRAALAEIAAFFSRHTLPA